METFDGNLDHFTRPQAGDESLFVVFYMGAVQDMAATEEAGRAIFRDVESVRIVIPGDKNNIVDRPADKSDRARFSKQYAMFKQGVDEESQIVGTRLKEWPMLTRAQVEEFKFLGIRTVEQLAELRDDVCSKIPGGYNLKMTAGTWLKRAQSTAEASKITKALKEAEMRGDRQDQVIADQARIIEELRSKLLGDKLAA